jgi:hypothetical protein
MRVVAEAFSIRENGALVFYDRSNREVFAIGVGEWYCVSRGDAEEEGDERPEIT